MNKPFIVVLTGLALVLALYLGFNNHPSQKNVVPAAVVPASSFDINKYIADTTSRFPAQTRETLENLVQEVAAAPGIAGQVMAYNKLAAFWKDSLGTYEPYAFYSAKASKLDNSEKSLTFAAQIFLNNLRWENDERKLGWETGEAIELFEKALAKNPESDDLKIGLGSSYILGRSRSGKPEETMKGIQQLLSVVRKDSTNMKAQFMLGMGGYISGQYDKAIERLHKVVKVQPENAEAIAFLADAYAAKGDKAAAIQWYNVSKRVVNDPHYSQEVDQRIKQLR